MKYFEFHWLNICKTTLMWAVIAIYDTIKKKNMFKVYLKVVQ